ncbi:MAG: hypothetical protein AABZ44_01520 [Elusimicrobiota bacterium]
MRYLSILSIIAAFGAEALAQSAPATGGALQSSNLLNPNISVIGWMQGQAGRSANAPAPDPFTFKEAELALQAPVDPYSRADVFIAFDPDAGADVEEAYLTWFRLPLGLGLKAGRFKAGFGRFNRTHTPETSFADRPLAHERYFGAEGLASAGAALSWHIPNPWLFIDLSGEVMSIPEAAEVPAFDKARTSDPLYVSRLGSYADISEATNLSWGFNYAHGTNGQNFDAINNASSTLNSQLYGLDLTLRWKDPKRAIYGSLLWQNELFWSAKETSPAQTSKGIGFLSHLEYQFARRWRAGIRSDLVKYPAGSVIERERGGLAYLSFTPSEFSLVSLQGKQVTSVLGTENLGFLKVTFNIGPHGAHPF